MAILLLRLENGITSARSCNNHFFTQTDMNDAKYTHTATVAVLATAAGLKMHTK